PGTTAPPRPPSGIGAPPGIRTTPDGIVWDCPTCGETNPIEAETCPVCGTTFGKLFQDTDEGPKVDPGHAAAMSLIFPGVGHYVAGRAAEGIARGIVFSFSLATGLLALFAGLGAGSPLFLVVMVVSLGSAAGLYVLSTLDAGRAAQDLRPIVSTRMLLYGAVGLMLLTLILLTIAAFGNKPPPG
ncbi:MAG: zinc ribbon domain-containing protein, partial [Actinomycetota bacterium]